MRRSRNTRDHDMMEKQNAAQQPRLSQKSTETVSLRVIHTPVPPFIVVLVAVFCASRSISEKIVLALWKIRQLGEGAVSSACLETWLIEKKFFIQHSLLHDPGHSALTVLTTRRTCVHHQSRDSGTWLVSLTFEFGHLFDLLSERNGCSVELCLGRKT